MSPSVPAGEGVPTMRIVDMRGPEVKVATSFAELQAHLSGAWAHGEPLRQRVFSVGELGSASTHGE